MNANPFDQARAAYSAGRFDQAYAICMQLLNASADNEHVRHLAAVSAAQANQFALACEHANVLVRTTTNLTYVLNAASVLERSGQLEAAKAANEIVLRNSPDHAVALANLANIARLSSDTDRALTLYQRATEQTQDPTVHANYAALLKQLGRINDARLAIERALAMEPDAPDLVAAAGDIAVADERYADAAALYQKALSRAPEDIAVMTNLSSALLRADLTDDALAHATRADLLDPGNRTAAAVRYIAALKQGRSDDAAEEMDTDACIARHDGVVGEGYGDINAFIDALQREVLAHPSLTFEPDGKTTRGGSQSGNLLPGAGPAVDALRDKITQYVDAYLDARIHPTLRAARSMVAYELNVWVTVLEKGGHQAPHIHPAGVVSGVFYVAVPNPKASAIEFGAPPDHYAPFATTLTQIYEPAEGTLLLFPSQYYHRTLDGHADGLRISIAFDAIPRGIDDDLAPGLRQTLQTAREALANGRFDVATQALAQLDQHAPDLAQSHAIRGRIHLAARRPAHAVRALSIALGKRPRVSAWWRTLATAHLQCGQYHDATAAIERALAIDPDDEAALMQLAATHTDRGDSDSAVSVYRRITARRPSAGQAWYGASLHGGAALDECERRTLHTILQTPDGLSVDDRVGLHFALARAEDIADDVDAAFSHFSRGNALKRQTQTFNADDEERNAKAIEAAFPAALFEQLATSGCDDATPVLIVGMPRSGSTLIEQVLSSHPDVAAAGESNALWRTLSALPRHLPAGARLPADVARVEQSAWAALAVQYVTQLRDEAGTEATYITDKLPFNYTLLGMLRIMLPKATIIDARRHPMDTCWSCFTTSFGNERGFTTDLSDLGRTYASYDHLMTHWQTVLPGDVRRVQYESLVANMERDIRALLEHLNLPWHDDCLRFFDNPRGVKTASAAQVRQQLYTSSIGRWRRYAAHLTPLTEALGPLAEN
ncbi:MAG: sulfotransferase [Pseudomonadota bacterium]